MVSHDIISTHEVESWQKILANGIADPTELFKQLELDPNLLSASQQAGQQFSMRIPQNYIRRMQKANFNDPLLRQVLPIGEELIVAPHFSLDPLAEKASNPLPGLLHKFKGRVLLTISGSCAIHCRYCFRRHFNYAENNPGSKGWEKVLQYIADDASIHEVIFSGGDPLAATDKQLAGLTQQLAAISHVKTLRIHSRMPIVLPERLTNELLNWFTGSRLQPVLVTHCNHAQEIDQQVVQALLPLRKAGVSLLNQSVLLKQVNDSAKALIDLSNALFQAGVLPYYLHMLDKVQGAAHFEVTDVRAQNLIWEIMQELPGYLVPKLVREQPGAPAKIPVMSEQGLI